MTPNETTFSRMWCPFVSSLFCKGWVNNFVHIFQRVPLATLGSTPPGMRPKQGNPSKNVSKTFYTASRPTVYRATNHRRRKEKEERPSDSLIVFNFLHLATNKGRRKDTLRAVCSRMRARGKKEGSKEAWQPSEKEYG